MCHLFLMLGETMTIPTLARVFIGFVLLSNPPLALASPLLPGRSAEQSKDPNVLIEEAARVLVSQADRLLNAGHLDAATKALEISTALSADNHERQELWKRLRERYTAMPQPHSRLDPAEEKLELFNGKSLAGWKKTKGKWEAQRQTITGDGGKSDAILDLTRSLKGCRGFTLSFIFRFERESGVGAILGTQNRHRVGVYFDRTGVVVYDFKTRQPIGTSSQRKFAPRRDFTITVSVDREFVVVQLNGKKILNGKLSDWEPGKLGFFARGSICLAAPELTPLELDICLNRAHMALKNRDPTLASSLLLRAEAIDPHLSTVAGFLATTLDRLGYRDAAANQARRFVDSSATDSKPGQEIRRLKKEAAALLERTDVQRAELDRCISDWSAQIVSAIEDALQQKRYNGLNAAVDALQELEIDGEILDDLRSRLFLGECPTPAGFPLFDGFSLEGWTVHGGSWEAIEDPFLEEGAPESEGVLAVIRGDPCNLIEAPPLPTFERYWIKTHLRGTGSYIDQGISFFVQGVPWSIKIFRFMQKREITMTRGDTTCFFRHLPPDALSSIKWHRLDVLVHMNRLTVVLDEKPLFTRILPAPPEPKLELVVGNERRGHYRQIMVYPVGRRGEYIETLERLNLSLMEVAECESLKSGTSTARGHVQEQPFAYDGQTLAGAMQSEDTHGLMYSFKTYPMENAVLSLRYSAPSRQRGPKDTGDPTVPTRIEVSIDGRPVKEPLILAPTQSAIDFTYAQVSLGSLDHGVHRVRLRAGQDRTAATTAKTRRGHILLDRLVLSPSAVAPTEETQTFNSSAAPHFKIRLSPGVQLPDESEKVFALLEVIREYMVERYGFEPADPQFYNLISRECWGDPHKGGYATGDNIYIPEDTTLRDLSVIMHELSHNFDRDLGFNPPWFGEGKSFPIYLQFTEDTRRRYREFQSPHAKNSLSAGEAAWSQLEHNGENLLQYWGTPDFPYWGRTPDGRDLTIYGYQAANWLCYELSRFIGNRTWLEDYSSLIRQEIANKTYFMPSDRSAANSVIVDYFQRSSDKDVVSFFTSKHFKLIDIYDWHEIVADCGDDDETYLTDPGGSRVEEIEDDEGKQKCRVISAPGATSYGFPVPFHAKSVVLEISWIGTGSCHAFDNRTFKIKTLRKAGRKTFRLSNPALWATSRLRLTFEADRFGDRSLKLLKIVLKKD